MTNKVAPLINLITVLLSNELHSRFPNALGGVLLDYSRHMPTMKVCFLIVESISQSYCFFWVLL